MGGTTILRFGDQHRVMCLACHRIMGVYPEPGETITCPSCHRTYRAVLMEDA